MTKLVLYNTYLRICNSYRNIPFNPRKDYETLAQEKKDALVKIEQKLQQFDNIDIPTFFQASFIENECTYLPLDHFAQYKAFRQYAKYVKRIDHERADSPDNIENTKKSIKHIYKVCKELGLTKIDNYFDLDDGNNKKWIVDLKKRNTYIYSMFLYPSPELLINNDKEVFIFTLGEDFYQSFNTFKMRFITSKKTKYLIQETKKRLNALLETQA